MNEILDLLTNNVRLIFINVLYLCRFWIFFLHDFCGKTKINRIILQIILGHKVNKNIQDVQNCSTDFILLQHFNKALKSKRNELCITIK